MILTPIRTSETRFASLPWQSRAMDKTTRSLKRQCYFSSLQLSVIDLKFSTHCFWQQYLSKQAIRVRSKPERSWHYTDSCGHFLLKKFRFYLARELERLKCSMKSKDSVPPFSLVILFIDFLVFSESSICLWEYFKCLLLTLNLLFIDYLTHGFSRLTRRSNFNR